MYVLYLITVTLHILTAMLWVGGMGFFAIVVVPTVRRNVDGAQAGRILRAAGARFAKVGSIALGILVVTGVGNLAFRKLLPALATAAFWRTSFGMTLALKVAFVALVFVLSAAHSHEARLQSSTHASPDRTRARIARQGRTMLLLSMPVVALAVVLVRGVA